LPYIEPCLITYGNLLSPYSGEALLFRPSDPKELSSMFLRNVGTLRYPEYPTMNEVKQY